MASPSRSGSLAMIINLRNLEFRQFSISKFIPLSIKSGRAESARVARFSAEQRTEMEKSRPLERPMEPQRHDVRKYPPTSALLASSAGLGWPTISVELRSHGVSAAPAIVPQHVENFLGCCRQQRRSRKAYWSRILPGGDAENGCDLVEPSRGWQGDRDNRSNPPNNASVPAHSQLLFDRLKDDFNLPVAPAHSIRSCFRHRRRCH